MLERATAFVLATGVVAVSAFAAVVGTTWGFGLKCDDSCGTAGTWRDDPSAWQWEALGTLGLTGFLFAIGLLAGVALRQRVIMIVALCGWIGVAAAFTNLLRTSGLASMTPADAAALVMLVCAGAASVGLTLQRRP